MGSVTTGIVVDGSEHHGVFIHVASNDDGHTRLVLELCECLPVDEVIESVSELLDALHVAKDELAGEWPEEIPF